MTLRYTAISLIVLILLTASITARAERIAVIDRIVDGTRAVLIIGDPPEREQVIPRVQLPEGAAEGTWLRVRFEGDRLAEAEIDHDETAHSIARIREKMDYLRNRGRAR